MEVEARIGEVVGDLRSKLHSKPKRRFLRDMEGQFLENETIMTALRQERAEPQSIVVSFDRRRGHRGFSYARFDLVLEVLDMIAGGSGITRPVSQLRVMRWHGTRRGLRRILRALARSNRELRFRRLLVMRYQMPEIGYRLYSG